MKLYLIALATLAIILPGCATHDGVYSPACVAFTGSTIELSAGRFTWEKFTDEMIIGEDGQAANPFPGYPLQGSYGIDGETLQMRVDTGAAIENMYLHEQHQRRYLLTAKQHETTEKTGEIDACALALGGTSHN